MSGNGWRQPKFRAEEINRAGLTVVLAEDSGAFLILRPQMVINVRNRGDHFFPAELVGEILWQRGSVGGLGARRLEMNSFYVGDQFFRRKNRQLDGSKQRGQSNYGGD